MNTHTPGPWFVLADPQWENHHPLHKSRYICNRKEWDFVDSSTHGEEWAYGFDDSEGAVICKMTDGNGCQSQDAKLIAAAPDLFDVCKTVVDAVRLGLINETSAIGMILSEKARLAYNKATN